MASMMDIRKRLLDGDSLPPLPDAYERVEYVASDGNGCNFDTGVCGNNDNLRIQACVCYESHTAYRGFIGNYVNETTNAWRILCGGNGYDKTQLFNRNNRANAALSVPLGQSIIGNKIYVDVIVEKSVATIKNSKNVRTVSSSIKGTDNNNNLALGMSRITYNKTTTSAVVRIYYCRIYDNGILIRQYIPCYQKTDNAVGFYDTVNKTFNSSTGGRNFLLPS